ncbi:MAG: hypothetical protein LBU87_00745, partial [Lactobacillales bacterium]|nr:hypothetical protein [Lactobacillales bacterium]
MKKFYLILAIALYGTLCAAQEVTIPLFDDETPRLGRNAEPLKSLVLTPYPLPPLSVEIDDKTPPKTETPATGTQTPQTAAPMTPYTPPVTVQTPPPPKRQTPITIAKEKQTDDLISALQKEIAQSQTPQVIQDAQRQEIASKIEKSSGAKPAQTAAAPVKPLTLEGLFGQMHDVFEFSVAGFMLGMTP